MTHTPNTHTHTQTGTARVTSTHKADDVTRSEQHMHLYGIPFVCYIMLGEEPGRVLMDYC